MTNLFKNDGHIFDIFLVVFVQFFERCFISIPGPLNFLFAFGDSIMQFFNLHHHCTNSNIERVSHKLDLELMMIDSLRLSRDPR